MFFFSYIFNLYWFAFVCALWHWEQLMSREHLANRKARHKADCLLLRCLLPVCTQLSVDRRVAHDKRSFHVHGGFVGFLPFLLICWSKVLLIFETYLSCHPSALPLGNKGNMIWPQLRREQRNCWPIWKQGVRHWDVFSQLDTVILLPNVLM